MTSHIDWQKLERTKNIDYMHIRFMSEACALKVYQYE